MKSPEVKARQRTLNPSRFALSSPCLTYLSLKVSVWAAVDQGLSDRIAEAVGHAKVQPLSVKPASEAVKYRANLGFAFTFLGRL